MSNGNRISWLDYTINNNPAGIMKVISDYGFVGVMAPQNIDEIKMACLDIMDMYGERGIMDILKAHPEFSVIQDTLSKQTSVNHSFLNATGTLTERLNNFIVKNPINQAFVALSVFVIVYYILSQIRKS